MRCLMTCFIMEISQVAFFFKYLIFYARYFELNEIYHKDKRYKPSKYICIYIYLILYIMEIILAEKFKSQLVKLYEIAMTKIIIIIIHLKII